MLITQSTLTIKNIKPIHNVTFIKGEIKNTSKLFTYNQANHMLINYTKEQHLTITKITIQFTNQFHTILCVLKNDEIYEDRVYNAS